MKVTYEGLKNSRNIFPKYYFHSQKVFVKRDFNGSIKFYFTTLKRSNNSVCQQYEAVKREVEAIKF